MHTMTQGEAIRKAHELGVVLEVFVPFGCRESFSLKSQIWAEKRARMESGLWLVLDDDSRFVVLRPVHHWKPQTVDIY